MPEKPIDVVRRMHEARQGYVWTVEGGRAVRFEWFNRPEEALAAVGLQASADTASSG
jgi:hypothetical protein